MKLSFYVKYVGKKKSDGCDTPYWNAYRSLNAILAQSIDCPFGVYTTIELSNIKTTSDNNAI
jgi:hypothetical protein